MSSQNLAGTSRFRLNGVDYAVAPKYLWIVCGSVASVESSSVQDSQKGL